MLPRALAMAGTALIISTTTVFADVAHPDGDTAKTGHDIVYLDSSSAGAEACSTRGTPVAGLVVIDWNGSTHFTAGATVAVTATPDATAAAAGVTASGSTATVPTGTAWNGNGDSFSAAISTTTPNTTGTGGPYTVNVSVTGPGSGPSSSGGVYTNGNPYTVTLTCTPAANTAPTVQTAAADAYGQEGDLLSTSGAFSDPDGDLLTLTADNTVGTFTDNGDGTWTWSYQTTAPVPLGIITVTADDAHSHTATNSFHYQATNVAPAVAYDSPASSANEGDTVTFNFTITDPGSTETYAFVSNYPDCGSGNTAANASITGKTGSFDCTFVDGLVPAVSNAVTVEVDDATDVSAEASTSVTVANVAPTGTFHAPSADVNEGSGFGLSISDVTDRSTVDTAAGFTYAFDCGSGYGSFTSTASVNCGTAVDGPATLDVAGKVRDKDGGVAEYTGSVTVDNVPPTLGTLSFSGDSGVACIGGNTVMVGAISWTDPAGALDEPFSVGINWGDTTSGTFGNINGFSLANQSHTYGAGGPFTISVTATDKDGGTSDAVTDGPFSFLYNVTSVLQPVNDTRAGQTPSLFKFGSTIPVKVEVTDCNGVPVSGLTPQIKVVRISGSTPPTGVDEASSTSAADTGTTMRWSDPLYIYNLATKSLSDASATYQITITGPFPTVNAVFGTKPK